jgi:hypothetical protein
MSERLAFAKLHISTIRNVKELIEVLKALPEEDRIAYTEEALGSKEIADGNELKDILDTFPEIAYKARLEFAKKYAGKIKDGLQLSKVLTRLHSNDRFAFAEKHRSLIKNKTSLHAVLSRLPVNDASTLMQLVDVKITNTDKLTTLLYSLSQKYHATFIMKYASITGGDLRELTDFLDKMPPNEKKECVQRLTQEIKNSSDIVTICKYLKDGSAFALIEKYSSCIITMSQAIACLRLVSEAKRAALAKSFEDLLKKEPSEIGAVATLLPSEVFRQFIIEHKSLIKSKAVINVLRSSSRAHQTIVYESQWRGLVYVNPLRESQSKRMLEIAETLMQLFNKMSILRFVPAQYAAKFIEDHVTVTNLQQLGELLSSVPLELIAEIAEKYQTFVIDGEDFKKVLESLICDRDSFCNSQMVLAVAAVFQNRITTLKELDDILNVIANKGVAIDHSQYAQGCSPLVKRAFLLREKKFPREEFLNPTVQQLMMMRKINPSDFLLAAARDEEREADFDFFLTHPLNAGIPLIWGVERLETYVEGLTTLSADSKARRIASIQQHRAKCKPFYMMNTYTNLTVVKEVKRQFTKTLPNVDEARWGIDGVAPNDIKRFCQLMEWLTTHPALADFKNDFMMLNDYESFETASAFKDILEELETFVIALNKHISKGPVVMSALFSLLDSRSSLQDYSERVRSALSSMIRALDLDVGIARSVDIALDQAIGNFARTMGIASNNEVHCSKDLLLSLLGVGAEFHADAHRLPITPYYLKTIAGQAMATLTPEFLIENSFPCLESEAYLTQKSGQLFDQAAFDLLLRDYDSLCIAAIVPKADASHDKIAAVLSLVSNWTEDEAKANAKQVADALTEDMKHEIRLPSPDLTKLRLRYKQELIKRGILMPLEEEKNLDDTIWALLTKNSFNQRDDMTWYDLFYSPDGLYLIVRAIEARSPEDWKKITPEALLYQPPGCDTNLYRAMACNPHYGPKLCNQMYSPSELYPLTEAMEKIKQDPVRLAKENEAIFIRSGNHHYWRRSLWEENHAPGSFYLAVRAFQDKHHIQDYRIDSLLELVVQMSEKGSDEERAMALSYLEAHIAKQKEFGLWECYWKTACRLKDFKLVLDNRDQLLSLRNPDNTRAALYFSSSSHALRDEVLRARDKGLIVAEETADIIKSIMSLVPRKLTLKIARPITGVSESKGSDDECEVEYLGP